MVLKRTQKPNDKKYLKDILKKKKNERLSFHAKETLILLSLFSLYPIFDRDIPADSDFGKENYVLKKKIINRIKIN